MLPRNKELERIDQENLKLMNRIVNQNPMLNTKKFEKEYRERRRLQKSLQRNRLLPIKKLMNKKKKDHERSASKLPVLQNATTPTGNDNHARLPQSVSSNKKRQNQLDEDNQNDKTIHEDHKNEDKQEKSPKSKEKTATSRKTGKATPGKRVGYVSNFN